MSVKLNLLGPLRKSCGSAANASTIPPYVFFWFSPRLQRIGISIILSRKNPRTILLLNHQYRQLVKECQSNCIRLAAFNAFKLPEQPRRVTRTGAKDMEWPTTSPSINDKDCFGIMNLVRDRNYTKTDSWNAGDSSYSRISEPPYSLSSSRYTPRNASNTTKRHTSSCRTRWHSIPLFQSTIGRLWARIIGYLL